MTSIPLSRPAVDDEIKRAVLGALDSRQYILGPECTAFETEFARWIGVGHVVLTNAGTAALWMALRALGVKPGDEVVVSGGMGVGMSTMASRPASRSASSR